LIDGLAVQMAVHTTTIADDASAARRYPLWVRGQPTLGWS
jgi:hypothetical protein